MGKKNSFNTLQAVRDSFLERRSRKGQLNLISKKLNCSYDTSKRLLFAFAYNAEDPFLEKILREDKTM